MRQREKGRGPDVSRRKKGGGGQRAVGPAPGPCAGPRRGKGEARAAAWLPGRLSFSFFFLLCFFFLAFQNIF